MARDYVSSRGPGKKKGRGRAQTQTSSVGFYIKLGFILLLVVAIISGIVYLKFNSPQQTKPDGKKSEKQESSLVDRRPEKDPYSYRKLLESSEIKTGNADQKRRNEQIYESRKRPDVIIDPKKKQETRAEEAARAQAILNGSLNTPRDEVTHTVRLGSNDEIIYLDGQRLDNRKNEASSAPVKTTAAQVEAGSSATVSERPKTTASAGANSKQGSSGTGSNAAGSAGAVTAQAKKTDSRAGVQNEKKSDSRADTRKDATQQAAGGRFYMQCGAFKKEEQANRLKNSIKSQGYSSTVSKAVVNSVTWYRVILGPYATHGMAEDVERKIKKIASNCNIYRR